MTPTSGCTPPAVEPSSQVSPTLSPTYEVPDATNKVILAVDPVTPKGLSEGHLVVDQYLGAAQHLPGWSDTPTTGPYAASTSTGYSKPAIFGLVGVHKTRGKPADRYHGPETHHPKTGEPGHVEIHLVAGAPHIRTFDVDGNGAIAVFAKTRRFVAFRNLEIGMMLVLPVFLHWSLGGFTSSGAMILWAATTVISARLWGARPGVVISSFSVLIIASAIADPWLVENVEQLARTTSLMLFVINIGGVSIVTFLVIRYFIAQRDRALGELEKERDRSAISSFGFAGANATRWAADDHYQQAESEEYRCRLRGMC